MTANRRSAFCAERSYMEKKNKIEKYPIIRYLSYLVIVSILLTSVSLARYTGASSGDIGATLSRFVCSYQISDASSLVFSNTDFWLKVEGEEPSATNTARTVRLDIANYVKGESADVDRISSVDLQSTLRFYAPAEFTGNLAVQVLSADAGSGAYTAITPQYVLKDLIYSSDGTFASGERIVKTADSEDYADRTDGLTGEEIAGLEQELSVTGGFTDTPDGHGHEGIICAEEVSENGNGVVISITSAMQTAHYSVGFMRSNANSGSAEVGGGISEGTLELPLFIDCEREMPFYTLDITLPEMYFNAGLSERKSFVLCLTTVLRTDSEDFKVVWGENTSGAIGGAAESWDDLLKTPAAGETYTLNGAKVTGYHFERKLPVFKFSDADGTLIDTDEETTVRITKEYDGEGGATLSYEHVAPLTEVEGSSSVEHPIAEFYRYSGNEMMLESADYDSVSGVNGWQSGSYAAADALYGLCSNGGKSGYIFFGNLSDDPYYETYAQQCDQGDRIYKLADALSKGYSSKLNVIFAQASESPKSQGGVV